MRLGLTQEEAAAQLAADVKRLDRESDAINEAMEKSGREQMKKLDEAKEAAEATRATAARLKAQYFEVLASAEAQERERLTKNNPTDEALKRGDVTAEAYLRDHLGSTEISARAKAYAAEKVRPILPAARAAALDALRAEVAVVELEVECAYCASAPLTARLEAMKARTKLADHAANIGLGALAMSMTARDTARRKLEISTGYSHRGGWRVDSLTVEKLVDLKLDPVIQDEQLARLEELIAEMGGAEGVVCESILISGDGSLRWVR